MTSLGKKESTQQYLLDKLSKAKAFIDNHPEEEYTIPDIAKEATLSEFHFSRCFKEIFGISPYQYYLKRKIFRSRQLLSNPGLDVTTIAMELGFSELSAFSRRFKKVYGVSPLQYKKRLLFSARPVQD